MVKKVADFLDLKVSDDVIDATVDKSSFSKMKKDPMANMSAWRPEELKSDAKPLMRKGKVCTLLIEELN